MANQHTGLPNDWVVKYSKSRSLPYYFNINTLQSQWGPPRDTRQDILEQYITENFSTSGPVGKIRCAHILVKHKDTRRPSSWKQTEITRTKEDARNIILDFNARIKGGELTLADLAASESDCSSARKRGDLGYFGRGEMQKEFEDAAFALQPGEMSRPVETASGVHLIERLE